MWRNKRKTEDGAAHRDEPSVRLAKFKCLGPAPLLRRGESRTAVYGIDSRKVFRNAPGSTHRHTILSTDLIAIQYRVPREP